MPNRCTDNMLRIRTLAISHVIVRRRAIAWGYRERNRITPIMETVREHIRDRQVYEPETR